MGTGVTAVCDGKPVRCGSFAAPLYGENAADASVVTLAAGDVDPAAVAAQSQYRHIALPGSLHCRFKAM